MKQGFIVLTVLLAGVPLFLVGALRFVPPPVSSFMLQSELWPIRYEWVPAERIAEVARKAVVASEDQKFWTHDGFDFEAMEEAYRANQQRRSRRGASTISQQTAKNLFLWPGGGYLRKGIEAYFTVLIELLWPKARILEVYLNIAEFGPGIYGVEAAAQKFFGKPAAKLSAEEAARLAAVLPNPKRWRAANPGSYVTARSAWILWQMGYRPRGRPESIEEPLEPPAEAPGEVEVVPPSEEPVVTPLPESSVPEPSPADTAPAPDASQPSAPQVETPAESPELTPEPAPSATPEELAGESPQETPPPAPLEAPPEEADLY